MSQRLVWVIIYALWRVLLPLHTVEVFSVWNILLNWKRWSIMIKSGSLRGETGHYEETTLALKTEVVLYRPVIVVILFPEKYNMIHSIHTHNISTISQMYSSGGCQTSSVPHRADNPVRVIWCVREASEFWSRSVCICGRAYERNRRDD